MTAPAAGHVERASPVREEVRAAEQPGRRRIASVSSARAAARRSTPRTLRSRRREVKPAKSQEYHDRRKTRGRRRRYNPRRMTTLSLETVEIEPKAKAEASVIWLHGLGADGHDFESLVPELRLPARPAIRFVFPHAPIRPVTLNGG